MFSDGLFAGVAPGAACARRNGDSGRGSEGRDFGLKAGLAGRARTDWLNFGTTDGVGGVPSSCSLIMNLSNESVVGVAGIDPWDVVGEERLVARFMGRKIPAPGIEVEK